MIIKLYPTKNHFYTKPSHRRNHRENKIIRDTKKAKLMYLHSIYRFTKKEIVFYNDKETDGRYWKKSS
jgi:hypothetical protein